MTLSLFGIILMAGQAGSDPGQGLTSTLVMFGSIILIFYFMIYRPQRKRQKERDALLGQMDKGDKVILAGGMSARSLQWKKKPFWCKLPRIQKSVSKNLP